MTATGNNSARLLNWRLLLMLMIGPLSLCAQQSDIDSLKGRLIHAITDSLKLELLNKIEDGYRNRAQLDSAIHYGQLGLELIQNGQFPPIQEVWQLSLLNHLANITDNYDLAMQYANRQIVLSERLKDNLQIAYAYSGMASVAVGIGDLRKALAFDFKARKAFERVESGHLAIQNIAELYLKLHMPDSALVFNKIAYHIADTGHNQQYMKDFAIRVFGNIYAEKGDTAAALQYYRQFIADFYQYNLNNREISMVYLDVARVFRGKGQADSAIRYARLSLDAARKYHDLVRVKESAGILYDLYSSINNEHEAFTYYRMASAAADSLLTIDKLRLVQNLSFNEQMREKDQAAADARQARQRTVFIFGASIVLVIATSLIWYRIRQLRLRHKMVLEQKEAEKLRAIDRMKEKFFTNITHELRTPLSLIMAPAAFYLEHPEELQDTPQLLKSIYRNSNYLLFLIDQLLDISKLDAGKMNLSLSRGSFGNYITGIGLSFEEQAVQKGIILHFANEVRGEYLFDAVGWKKIIHNLVGNALKFTPAGGDIYLAVRQTTQASDAGMIEVSVRDTGIGIDKEQIPYITDRFYQADNQLTRAYEGAGIGLSLVNELVKLMNGRLEIDSERGKGSVFTITMALASAAGRTDIPEASPPAVNGSLPGYQEPVIPVQKGKNGTTILIAEDNTELKDFLQKSLGTSYNILTAGDGAHAYELTLSHRPDLIVSDIMMPVMDGLELCDKVKNNPSVSHIPFIILSARTTEGTRIAGWQRGADDYLTKPFSVDELQSRIGNMLERSAQYRIKRAEMEHQILDLEARALRAQMNPHFIFNCMNSIKALIQQKEEDKSITYLTTFSKLIRTIFQNSDKREISLYDEIETCRLYIQLESMRFGNKFNYSFSVDSTIDLKSLLVPALVVQPFIENAIWHGIVPKEQGGSIHIKVNRQGEDICCIIDDDGIGREMSMQNKFAKGTTHQSKGVHLTQSRINLNNVLNARNASIDIIDKKDTEGRAAGTMVILTFKELES